MAATRIFSKSPSVSGTALCIYYIDKAATHERYRNEDMPKQTCESKTTVSYLGLLLNSAWSWDVHIAAAYRKGLGALHAWRSVLVSPRVRVAAKVRVIHSVICPVLCQ
jgi:hypothetical protein